MRTRIEILRLAQEVADAVADSKEMQDLLRCEAQLGPLAAGPLDPDDPDPRVQAYVEAKQRAERLLQQVTGVFLFPLTGHLSPAQSRDRGCEGCGA